MEKENTLNYFTYITPSYIYLPIDSKENIKIRKDKVAFLGSLLSINKNYNSLSSISGKIIGLESVNYVSGEKLSLVIENNYLDKKQKIKGCKKIISEFTKKDSNELLDLYNLKRNFTHKKTLFINMTRYRNNLCASKFTIIEKSMEFLEAIDALCDIYDLYARIVITSCEQIIIESLKKYLGMYTKIKIETVSNGLNNEEILNKNTKENCVIYSDEEILRVYEAFKRDSYYSYHHLLLVHNNKPIYIKTKIGTMIEELLFNLKFPRNIQICKITTDKVCEVDIKNMVITEDINVIEI